MKVMKKIMAVFIACLTITLAVPAQIDCVVLTVEAHSGRTDKYGGHKDNKNVSGLGSYHYHCGGNPAHLHENGFCPYAGNIGTASTSSTSSAKTNSKQKVVETSASNNNTTQNNSSKQAEISKNVTEFVVTISDTSYDNVAFNASYYANNHVDVYQLYGDDLVKYYNHFIEYGVNESRVAK